MYDSLSLSTLQLVRSIMLLEPSVKPKGLEVALCYAVRLTRSHDSWHLQA
jgi:hypothetical protein